jgi:Spy/CpxP family protein refolding chaperone
MKTPFSPIAVLVLLLIAGGQTFSAVVDHADADVRAPEVQKYFPTPKNNEVLTEVLTVKPPLPRGPNEILAGYEAEMAKIASRMSKELGEICQAIANGQLSREQSEYLARERYQIATMQFQLFSAWHDILEQSVAQASPAQTTAAQSKDDPSPTGQAVVLALPFSSLQLNSSLAQYLQLTPEQISAIAQLMARERPYVTPLMAELDATRQKLEMATRNAHPDQKQISSLALTQARLLTKLVAENSDLQAKISRLLNSEQRRKMEKLRQDNELSGLRVE